MSENSDIEIELDGNNDDALGLVVCVVIVFIVVAWHVADSTSTKRQQLKTPKRSQQHTEDEKQAKEFVRINVQYHKREPDQVKFVMKEAPYKKQSPLEERHRAGLDQAQKQQQLKLEQEHQELAKEPTRCQFEQKHQGNLDQAEVQKRLQENNTRENQIALSSRQTEEHDKLPLATTSNMLTPPTNSTLHSEHLVPQASSVTYLPSRSPSDKQITNDNKHREGLNNNRVDQHDVQTYANESQRGKPGLQQNTHLTEMGENVVSSTSNNLTSNSNDSIAASENDKTVSMSGPTMTKPPEQKANQAAFQKTLRAALSLWQTMTTGTQDTSSSVLPDKTTTTPASTLSCTGTLTPQSTIHSPHTTITKSNYQKDEAEKITSGEVAGDLKRQTNSGMLRTNNKKRDWEDGLMDPTKPHPTSGQFTKKRRRDDTKNEPIEYIVID